MKLRSILVGNLRRALASDRTVALLLGSLYVAGLLMTARSLGFARDEGFYFSASSSYARWFQLLIERGADALRRSSVDGVWSQNHEHPALMKTLFAFSWLLFHEKWRLFADASTAFRFPGMCMGGLLVGTTYLFGARALGRRAGLVAALLTAFMPRLFYNAHLACFDVGIAAMWTLTIYLYWRSLASPRPFLSAVLVGVVYGLTLETKHNAWILPAVLFPHALLVQREHMLRRLRAWRPYFPPQIVAMSILGPLVFVGLWPWLWNDTLPRIEEYVNFHLNHVYYNMEFLGVNYFGPPSPIGYMPVMILATVPSITLLLFALGLGERVMLNLGGRLQRTPWRFRHAKGPGASLAPALRLGRDSRETDLLFALAFLAAIGPFLLPRTPIFGGTKHWLGAYPFLALFAGRGFDIVANQAERVLSGSRLRLWQLRGPSGAPRVSRPWWIDLALVVSVTVAPAAITYHSHPFGLSSYVPFVGGTRGGASLGLNRQFWGFTTQSANEEFLSAHAPFGATVFIHDTAWDSWSRMLDERRVRPDLRGVGSISESSYALIHHELHMNEVDYQIWVAYGTDAPVYVVTHDDVPIVSIYRKP